MKILLSLFMVMVFVSCNSKESDRGVSSKRTFNSVYSQQKAQKVIDQCVAEGDSYILPNRATINKTKKSLMQEIAALAGLLGTTPEKYDDVCIKKGFEKNLSCKEIEALKELLVELDKYCVLKELGPGCDGQAGSDCRGGYGFDKKETSIPIRVVFGSQPGKTLTDTPNETAQGIVNKINKNYVNDGHRLLDLKLKEVIVDEAGKSDAQLVSEYTGDNGKGVLSIVLVDNIPGGTVGYVQHMCADLDKGEGWIVFEYGFTLNSVVAEHEINHVFCLPHTSSQNGGTPKFFLSGYNPMESVLKDKRALKKPILPSFKVFIDPQNRPDAEIVHDGMVYKTNNLMYYRVLANEPGLFEKGSTGYNHSFSHTLDYYHRNFVQK